MTFDAEILDEACQGVAEIYAHWLATEGAAILARVAAEKRESA